MVASHRGRDRVATRVEQSLRIVTASHGSVTFSQTLTPISQLAGIIAMVVLYAAFIRLACLSTP